MSKKETQSPTIIRLPEVVKRTGVSRSSIYLLMAANDFPKKIQLSQRSIGFDEAEVTAWIRARIAGEGTIVNRMDGNKLAVKGGV